MRLIAVVFLLVALLSAIAQKEEGGRRLRNNKKDKQLLTRKSKGGSSSSQQTVETGKTFLTSSVDGLSIKEKSTTCMLVTEKGYLKSKCIEVKTTSIANHVMGPWCSGGFWDKKNVNFPSSTIYKCTCQRFHCDTTCNDICMECEPEGQSNTYLIPLDPYVLDEDNTYLATDDNNFGDGLALNGVPLTKSDPFDKLTGQNNIAPLDPNGGHSTLQMTYHYHSIPTIFFDCSTGWDPTKMCWAEEAPDGQHSPQIGWGLDGLPIYGPFSDGGSIPRDLSNCGAHTHGDIGWHYHANFDGETRAAFLGCYQGARADQDWDDEIFAEDDTVTTADCPVTTYTSAHSIEDSMSKYFSVVSSFDSKTCKDVERVVSRR